MAGEQAQRKFSVMTLLGTLGGGRGYDKAVRVALGTGFAGALCILLLREWRGDRDAERAQRHQEHIEMVAVMRDQHREDIEERRRDRCVNAQLNDTVRSAIWKERPRPREECR